MFLSHLKTQYGYGFPLYFTHELLMIVINLKNTRILFKDMFRQDLCHLQFTR